MSRHQSRLRHRGSSPISREPVSPRDGAAASRGLASGTEIARTDLGGRTVAFVLATSTSLWCNDTGRVAPIGVIVWGDGLTPHLRCNPNDRLHRSLTGLEAEQVVQRGMAAWRAVGEGLPLDPRLRVHLSQVAIDYSRTTRRQGQS